MPAALPSLIKAYRIQDKARNVGFDWEEREQVWDKVKEEIREFQTEVAHMDKEKLKLNSAMSCSASSTLPASTKSIRTMRWNGPTRSSSTASTM